MRRLYCIVGARPNFMKIAPIMRALAGHTTQVEAVLVHTGQHYDEAMNARFFQQLAIPVPAVNLEVGSGSHAAQTAEVMKRFDALLDRDGPPAGAAVLVVGDVNSSLACALVASKRRMPVVHVEAGLRSYDRDMPEEINRVLTDQISDLLFTTERSAAANLEREGVAADKVRFVGNVMIDSLLYCLPRAPAARQVLEQAAGAAAQKLAESGYGLVTLHRPSNVDDPAVLERILEALLEVSAAVPLVLPLHPRAAARIAELSRRLARPGSALQLVPPLGYLEMIGLMAAARIVLTDSGGVQEETTGLNVPCLTLRENTERPITVEQGTNTLVGTDPQRIVAEARAALRGPGKAGRMPELWDGRAAQRIADDLTIWLAPRARAVPC